MNTPSPSSNSILMQTDRCSLRTATSVVNEVTQCKLMVNSNHESNAVAFVLTSSDIHHVIVMDQNSKMIAAELDDNALRALREMINHTLGVT